MLKEQILNIKLKSEPFAFAYRTRVLNILNSAQFILDLHKIFISDNFS